MSAPDNNRRVSSAPRSDSPAKASHNDAQSIDLDELIRTEIAGKNAASGRYDDILWKIRAGYGLALYGALGFLITRDEASRIPSSAPLHSPITGPVVALVIGLSLLCWFFDAGFRRRQLRVVIALNALLTLAATRTNDPAAAAVLPFLTIAGESPTLATEEARSASFQLKLRSLAEGLIIYGGTIAVTLFLRYS